VIETCRVPLRPRRSRISQCATASVAFCRPASAGGQSQGRVQFCPNLNRIKKRRLCRRLAEQLGACSPGLARTVPITRRLLGGAFITHWFVVLADCSGRERGVSSGSRTRAHLRKDIRSHLDQIDCAPLMSRNGRGISMAKDRTLRRIGDLGRLSPKILEPFLDRYCARQGTAKALRPGFHVSISTSHFRFDRSSGCAAGSTAPRSHHRG